MELQGTVQGTMLYLGLYMGFFVPLQSFSKFYLLAQHKKEDKKASLREVKYYSRDKVRKKKQNDCASSSDTCYRLP